jgi:hypothetical protein
MIGKNDHEKLVPCTDLALASYLVSIFTIVKIDATNSNKVIFLFKDSPELQKSINAFWNNTAKISPLDYFNNIKNLKTRIHLER